MPDEIEERLEETASDLLLGWQQTTEASGLDESDPVAQLELFQQWTCVQIAAIKMTIHEVVAIVEADKGIEIDEITPGVVVTKVEPTQVTGATEPESESEPEPLDGGWSNAKVELGRGVDVYRRGDRGRRASRRNA